MIKERGRAKNIITLDDSQVFALNGAVKRITAYREGFLWWNRRYTVVERSSTGQGSNKPIIDGEKYLTERAALSAARERLTGQMQHKADMESTKK